MPRVHRVAPRANDLLFYGVFGALTILTAVPFWLTRILPMQDYPHFLVFARVYGDCRDPSSPFFGTYTTGFALSPLLAPILATRALSIFGGIETGGRLLWTLYAVGLPIASLYLLRVLGRDRWAVLLVFPIAISYWVVGGFFAFATSAPLLVLGLALAVRWLTTPSWRYGAALSAVLCALHLWHALTFAQLMFDFGVLWLLARHASLRARATALAPLAPPLVLFAAWLLATVQGRSPGGRPPVWPPFVDNATHFFDYIGPILPQTLGAVAILAVVLLAGAVASSSRPAKGTHPFRIENPFALLALLAVVSYLVFPGTTFGVEGINNRQPWIAALLFVFGWTLPARPAARAALLAAVGGAGALVLVHLGGRFAAFERESGGASRLLDRVGPRDSVLGPIGVGSTQSFPGKPLIAVELYATIRQGGLPNTSFAGYDINFVRYVGGRNPMPAIGGNWIAHPSLRRFDYVLLRGQVGAAAGKTSPVRLVAEDGEWSLFAVCGSKARPECS